MIPKFRAWDKTNNKMISWRHLLNGHNLRNVFMRTEMCGLELMQSTGLKDKAGVEIYEGDIVQYTWDLPDDVNATEKGKKVRVNKVFWSDWRASFAIGKKSSNCDLFRYVRNGNTVEVIGNIYENPELLEGEK